MIKIEQIHNKLSEAIKKSGLTQSEIARRLNVRQSNISHYIKGDKMPALDTFANLCAILDLDTDDILCVSDYKNK
ncbi:MAG: helix-turn-helix transcriptional regulator [Clostridiales bacterium]|nr:helix-turn-helix transcriptional regulator [Clostridiales bacterium]